MSIRGVGNTTTGHEHNKYKYNYGTTSNEHDSATAFVVQFRPRPQSTTVPVVMDVPELPSAWFFTNYHGI